VVAAPCDGLDWCGCRTHAPGPSLSAVRVGRARGVAACVLLASGKTAVRGGIAGADGSMGSECAAVDRRSSRDDQRVVVPDWPQVLGSPGRCHVLLRVDCLGARAACPGNAGTPGASSRRLRRRCLAWLGSLLVPMDPWICQDGGPDSVLAAAAALRASCRRRFVENPRVGDGSWHATTLGDGARCSRLDAADGA